MIEKPSAVEGSIDPGLTVREETSCAATCLPHWRWL